MYVGYVDLYHFGCKYRDFLRLVLLEYDFGIMYTSENLMPLLGEDAESPPESENRASCMGPANLMLCAIPVDQKNC